MATFAKEIESPVGTGYEGTMEAKVFELNEQAQPASTQEIRNTQDWGVTVNWEMHGPTAAFLPCDFNLKLYLDRLGPGADLGPFSTAAPIAALSVPLVAGQRVYTADIPMAAGTVPDGAYELAVLLQTSIGGANQPYAGIVTIAPVNIFAAA